MAKIWVSQDWYIPVDEYGYVIGPCFEGMLGCVLQLRHGVDDTKKKTKEGIEEEAMKAALKIPRLLADTVEENAYICKVTKDEEKAVTKISNAGGRIHDILDAQFFATKTLIKPRVEKQWC